MIHSCSSSILYYPYCTITSSLLPRLLSLSQIFLARQRWSRGVRMTNQFASTVQLHLLRHTMRHSDLYCLGELSMARYQGRLGWTQSFGILQSSILKFLEVLMGLRNKRYTAKIIALLSELINQSLPCFRDKSKSIWPSQMDTSEVPLTRILNKEFLRMLRRGTRSVRDIVGIGDEGASPCWHLLIIFTSSNNSCTHTQDFGPILCLEPHKSCRNSLHK